MTIKLYTDGACSGNPGPGGWAFAIVKDNEIIHSDSSQYNNTTNNKMELSAACFGIDCVLAHFPNIKKLSIFTDSAYTMNSMKDWVHNWKKNNWKKSNGKPVENIELIQRLYHLCYESFLEIEWVKVKAHQKKGSAYYDPFNEYVDKLATGEEKPKKTFH